MTSIGTPKNLKTVARHTFVYGIGIVLQKGLSFFLIPLYTHYLSPAEYGVSHLVALTSGLIVFFISLNMSYALLRFFAKYQDTERENLVVSTALVSVAVVGSLSLVLLLPLSRILSIGVTGGREYSHLFMLMAVYNVFEILGTCCLTYLRAIRKSVVFVLLSLIQFLCAMGMNILFIAGKGYGVTGIWLSAIISQSVLSVPLALWLLRRTGFGFSTELLREMLRYGMPMLPGNISEFLMHYIDRPFLRILGSLELVGTYSLGHKFGVLVCLLVVNPFEQIWSAHLFSIAEEENAKHTYARVATFCLMALVVAALAVAIFAPLAIRMMANSRYHSAVAVVPIIVAAYTCFGMSRVFRTGLMLKQRTGLVSLVTVGSICVEVLLDIILIPRYGMPGAAAALCAGFFVMAAVTCAVATYHYPIAFEYGRMLCIVAGAIGCFFLSRSIRADRMAYEIGLKLLLWLGLVGVLAAVELIGSRQRKASREPATTGQRFDNV